MMAPLLLVAIEGPCPQLRYSMIDGMAVWRACGLYHHKEMKVPNHRNTCPIQHFPVDGHRACLESQDCRSRLWSAFGIDLQGEVTFRGSSMA